jgi:hypothetical protein
MVSGPGAQGLREGRDRGIAEIRSAPQRGDLLRGLHQAQPGVGGVEVDHVRHLLGQQPVLAERQPSHQPDPAGQPSSGRDQGQRRRHHMRARPFNADPGKTTSLGDVVEEPDQEHVVVLLQPRDQQRFSGDRPPGQPRDRAPRPVRPVDQRVRHPAAFQHRTECGAAPPHLSIGKQRYHALVGRIRTPGFMMAAGSSSAFAPRSASVNSGGTSRRYQRRWSRPTAW